MKSIFISRTIKAILLVITFFAYPLSYLVPRSSSIWVFGSWYGNRFADNPKYLFLYCNKFGRAGIFPVWISADKLIVSQIRRLGFTSFYRYSLRGLYYSLRAKVYIFDCRSSDINYTASGNSLKINLWHGIPLKKIERDIDNINHPIRRSQSGSLLQRAWWKLRAPANSEHYDFVISTSQKVSKTMQSAFSIQQDKVMSTGYPRNDILLSDRFDPYVLENELGLISDLRRHKCQGERIIIYMPTFRDHDNSRDKSIPINWNELDILLGKYKGKMLCKLHALDQASIPHNNYKNIFFVPSSIDMYPTFKWSDALVTDYSSVYFDYLLLKKPLMFYPYDLDEYQSCSRSFYYNYSEVTPGPRAYDPIAFNNMILDFLENYDDVKTKWDSDRLRVMNEFHEYADGKFSERLYNNITSTFCL